MGPCRGPGGSPAGDRPLADPGQCPAAGTRPFCHTASHTAKRLRKAVSRLAGVGKTRQELPGVEGMPGCVNGALGAKKRPWPFATAFA